MPYLPVLNIGKSTVYAPDMTASRVANTPVVVNLPNGPYASGSTPVISGVLVDGDGNGIPASSLGSFTLTLVDALSGVIINGVDQVNVLNTGRGKIDGNGNFTITLLPADTAMSEVPSLSSVERSAILSWTLNAGATVGRWMGNFTLLALGGEVS